MRALITGATGFAGSHLAQHLLEQGDQVLGSSRHATWPAMVPATVTANIDLLRWDVADTLESEPQGIIEDFQPDCIFHLAAISVPQDCGASDPTLAAVNVNLRGTRRVMELARRCGNVRLVFISSAYVYSPLSSPSSARDFLVNESSPSSPTSAYGQTKLQAERLLLAAGPDMDVVIARAFAHTGPRQGPRMMLPEWCSQVARGESPIRIHTLDSNFDLCDVRDVVRSYRLLALSATAGEVYNVGSGRSVRSGDVFERLQRIVSETLHAVETAHSQRQHVIADIGKLTRTTGWLPEIPLDQTVRDTLDYWVSRHQERRQ